MNHGTDTRLMPCPFCGSVPAMRFIGNDRTKSRAVTIKCSNSTCRIERTDKAFSHDHAWLATVAIEGWNRRATQASAELGSIGGNEQFQALLTAYCFEWRDCDTGDKYPALIAFIDARCASPAPASTALTNSDPPPHEPGAATDLNLNTRGPQ